MAETTTLQPTTPEVEPTAPPRLFGDAEAPEVARAAFEASERALRQEPLLVIWAVLGQMLGVLLNLAPLFVLMLVMAVQVAALTQGAPLDGVSDGVITGIGLKLLGWALKPDVILGTLGMTFVVWLAAWAIGVVVDSGTLGALRRRLRAGSGLLKEATFWEALGERFGALLVWRGLRQATLLCSGMLTVGLVWAGLGVMARLGVTAGSGLGELVLLCSVLGLLGALGALSMLVWGVLFDVALGRMIMVGEGLGDALWSAAEVVGENLEEGVRLFGMVLSFWGGVYGLYVPFYIMAVVLGSQPELSDIATVLQMGLDTLLALAVVVLSLVCRGAVLAWVGAHAGVITEQPVLPEDVEPSDQLDTEHERLKVAEQLTTAPVGDLSPLMPQDTPHIVSISELIAASGGPNPLADDPAAPVSRDQDPTPTDEDSSQEPEVAVSAPMETPPSDPEPVDEPSIFTELEEAEPESVGEPVEVATVAEDSGEEGAQAEPEGVDGGAGVRGDDVGE